MFIMACFKYQLTDEKSTVPWCVLRLVPGGNASSAPYDVRSPHGVFLHICNKKDGMQRLFGTQAKNNTENLVTFSSNNEILRILRSSFIHNMEINSFCHSQSISASFFK